MRWLGVLGLALVLGCGGGVTRPPLCKATGTLLYDGKPAVGALVVFQATTKPTIPFPPPRARTRDGGVFEVETYEAADGVPEGDYIVTVDWHSGTPGAGDAETDVKSLVPDRYLVKEKSPLRATVAKGADGVCMLPPLKMTR